ncbi:hypothetical protein [Terasakiella sp. SH-1]|uniref:hypothetical protein n=1 Tax=Terasakiella sp. SH-1 TaxID=2560057 RepID=UPI0010734A1B|nr:hypothetical protein [Terasakiella sp. SH-1]
MLFDQLEILLQDVHDSLGVPFIREPIGINRVLQAVRKHCAIDDIEIIITPALANHHEVSENSPVPPHQVKGVRGMYERVLRGETQKTIAKIHINANQNICWRRFTACKELMHILLDDAQSRITDAKELTSLALGLSAEFSRLIFDEDLHRALNNEELAEMAAVEVLFPLYYRHAFVCYRGAGTEIPDDVIAQLFRIPERYVSRVLNKVYHQRILEMCYGFEDLDTETVLPDELINEILSATKTENE